MDRKCHRSFSLAGLAASLVAVQAGAAGQAAPTDLDQLARRVVLQNAGVREGEIVMIEGRPRDLELLENIATQVRAAGAFPLVTITTDRLLRRSFTDVPEKFDSQAPKLNMALADLLDVVITMGDLESPDLLADVPNVAARRNARSQAEAATFQAFVKNDVRLVEIGNGLYPMPWRAQRIGVPPEALAKMFWEGVNLDYSALQERAAQIESTLAAGKDLRITGPNGTDLSLSIAGRPIVVSDGIISPDDVKKGGAAVLVYLPAGEVMTTPVPGSARGTVVVDRTHFDGQEVQNLRLAFADGRLTSMSGSGPGYPALQAQYEAGKDADKAALAFVDLGINDKVRLPPDSQVGTWVPAGMVTIGLGNNIGFGGDNASSYGLATHLRGVTVVLDGKPIVENGNLQL